MGGRLGTPVCSTEDGKQGDNDYLDVKLADIIKVQHLHTIINRPAG